LVRRYAGFDEVQDLFYSRKNYKRPELQQEPHRTFSDEATLLDSMFHGNFKIRNKACIEKSMHEFLWSCFVVSYIDPLLLASTAARLRVPCD